jgi:hypothetical protein
MPCGCNKGRTPAVLPPAAAQQQAPRTTTRVAVYEVVKDGDVVLSTTRPTAARQEASRLGASIRVSSRPAEAGDPVPV